MLKENSSSPPNDKDISFPSLETFTFSVKAKRCTEQEAASKTAAMVGKKYSLMVFLLVLLVY